MNTCDVLTAALLLSLKVERKCWTQFKKTRDVWLFYLPYISDKNLQCFIYSLFINFQEVLIMLFEFKICLSYFILFASFITFDRIWQ
jgi:hypothetical protein